MARSSLSDRALKTLAREAGLSVVWTDAFGKKRNVSPDTLRAVLAALGYPAHSQTTVEESHTRLREEKKHRAASGEPVRAYYPDVQARRLWGVAVQLYSLRGGTTDGFGDFAALKDYVGNVARSGADAVAISPVHAAMPGSLDRYSPYSPSTRLFLDPRFAPLDRARPDTAHSKLIDWQKAAPAKMGALERAHGEFRRTGADHSLFAAFVRQGGERLLAHARFEALHARFAVQGLTSWRSWPNAYRNPESREVRALGATDPDVERHLFFQWRAATGLADAQREARAAGMAIGIVIDLAVGMDRNGSHVWHAPHEVLDGLSIGAPPDLLAPDGQNWGLTALSPSGLHRANHASFIATLRASMQHGGGIRLDHALGLRRLWVIPEGAGGGDGVYLAYPFEELLRVIVAESVRSKAAVVGEDLGTVPPGFRSMLTRVGILGMRVLRFERENGDFRAPKHWDRNALALTTTHDLPTTAGWWRGRDLEWRTKISRDFPEADARRERDKDRKDLWRALKRAGCAKGTFPGPAQDQDVVDAAISFVAKARSKLALVAAEDIVGAREQPNLPGTIDEHPNWRRRLPIGNGLGQRRAEKRLSVLARARPRP